MVVLAQKHHRPIDRHIHLAVAWAPILHLVEIPLGPNRWSSLLMVRVVLIGVVVDDDVVVVV